MSPIFLVLLFVTVISANGNENLLPFIILPPQITACGPNGVLSDCASRCPLKCSNYRESKPRFCTDDCVKGCKCHPGYIIDDASGLCISPQYCNKIVASNS
ncbi:venom peptide SjAPI-2-like [Leptopilina boulardi]|uniref:venom peptide SjAPI-2-like n=1 Tax=Leptopilina boulardi TaxID=63433 RepID=UPI0021F60EC9|nr:venom peptide SjAPI-2-like [Leptopilina boulardi]